MITPMVCGCRALETAVALVLFGLGERPETVVFLFCGGFGVRGGRVGMRAGVGLEER